MTSTLAILLYLQSIVCCTTYSSQTINQIEASRQPEITAIQQDPELYQYIQHEYQDEALSITVWDEPSY